MKHQPQHMRDDNTTGYEQEHIGDKPTGAPGADEIPDHVHPLGIPFPDTDGAGEYIPIPGDTRVDMVTPNGAVVRNPWSDQPEIKPDYAYTDEQDDMKLLIM